MSPQIKNFRKQTLIQIKSYFQKRFQKIQKLKLPQKHSKPKNSKHLKSHVKKIQMKKSSENKLYL